MLYDDRFLLDGSAAETVQREGGVERREVDNHHVNTENIRTPAEHKSMLKHQDWTNREEIREREHLKQHWSHQLQQANDFSTVALSWSRPSVCVTWSENHRKKKEWQKHYCVWFVCSSLTQRKLPGRDSSSSPVNAKHFFMFWEVKPDQVKLSVHSEENKANLILQVRKSKQ